MLEIFSIFPSAGFVGCFVFCFIFLVLFLWLFLVSSLYTPCIPIGVLFLVLIHLFINQKKKKEQPLGLVAQWEIGRVYRLRQSLYGLKQSFCAWFGKFSEVIVKFGMQKSKSDHSVFYRNSQASIILLVVYVDDIIITGDDMAGISSLKSFLHGQFHTKDLSMLKYFLGIEVMRSKCGIFLS